MCLGFLFFFLGFNIFPLVTASAVIQFLKNVARLLQNTNVQLIVKSVQFFFYKKSQKLEIFLGSKCCGQGSVANFLIVAIVCMLMTETR